MARRMRHVRRHLTILGFRFSLVSPGKTLTEI